MRSGFYLIGESASREGSNGLGGGSRFQRCQQAVIDLMSAQVEMPGNVSVAIATGKRYQIAGSSRTWIPI